MTGVVREPVSSGGVVVRDNYHGETEALLIRQRGEWRLPKGMAEAGESLPATAFREVSEETGLRAAIVERLSHASWSYIYEGVLCTETCTFFLMLDVGLEAGDHDSETESIAWMRPADAVECLAYQPEQEAVVLALQRWEAMNRSGGIGVAPGETTGVRIGSGRLVLDRGSAEEVLAAGQGVVLVLNSFSPRDAGLIGECSGVASVREGPSSHVSVVAASLGIPCLTKLAATHLPGALIGSGDILIPAGATVQVDEATRQLRLLLPTAPRAHHEGAADQMAALDAQVVANHWAAAVAAEHGLASPANWKLFKRDLLGRFLPTPDSVRFHSPWDARQVASTAVELTAGGTVRCSAFPRTIACHAVSFTVTGTSVDKVLPQVSALDPTADLELFIQQDPGNLCWRLVSNQRRFTLEAGLGQAMYVFEEERGQHAVALATWSADDQPRLSGDARVRDVLRTFLERYQIDLSERCVRLGDELELDVFALEGYFHIAEKDYVAVDMDLPFDWAFMGAPDHPA